MSQQYSEKDRRVMASAYHVTTTLQGRLDDVVKYSKEMQYTKIGIAYCVSVTKWAKVAENYLRQYFDVVSIHCKNGRIFANEIVDDAKGISCNPKGQASYLEGQATDLNLTMGLCIGHDALFNQYSHAPVSNLMVKDRKHQHDIVRSIETKVNTL